jgi:hypothetical protein
MLYPTNELHDKYREILMKHGIVDEEGTPFFSYVDVYMATVDGNFTSDQLRKIAAAMDEWDEFLSKKQ